MRSVRVGDNPSPQQHEKGFVSLYEFNKYSNKLKMSKTIITTLIKHIIENYKKISVDFVTELFIFLRTMYN